MNNITNADLANYLESMVNLDALDRMNEDMNNELKDSQAVMNEIKEMIDSLPSEAKTMKTEPDNNGLRHEDLSNFLAAGTPQLILPDMDNSVDVDLDDVIATLKSYVEDIRKNIVACEPVTQRPNNQQFENLELGQYALSLDQLSKRLSNMQLHKQPDDIGRNAEIDVKLSTLCDDINMFTQLIQTRTIIRKTNKNWSPMQQNTNALEYDNIINRLLADINKVSYLIIANNKTS